MRGKRHLTGREEPIKGNFGKRLTNEAKKQGIPIEEQERTLREAEQQTLLQEDGMTTPGVQGDKMLCKFIKPHFEMDEDDRLVSLEFSIALSNAHKCLVDDEVLDAWKFIASSHVKRVVGIDIRPQTVDVFLAPDMDSELHLTSAMVTQATISTVEKTGDGKEETITRLQFRLKADLMKNVIQFATSHYGDQVWIKMKLAQGVLAETA